ncbi:MAG: transposase [Myxococcota bacterium]
MVRGIERRALFFDDRDREDLLLRLSRLVPELGFRCFAWVFMPNHVHLVLRSGPVRISRLMARLGTGYAGRFNSRHGRVGHLFQNRFRSRCATDDADLMGLVLYVIRNPLDAGIVHDVEALESFWWCGLGALLGHRPAHPFEAAADTLELFDAAPGRARHRLRAQLGSPTLAPSNDGANDTTPRHSPVRQPSESFESLVHAVCSRFEIRADELRSRSRTRRVSAARREVVRRAARELGLSGAEIARRLGVTKAAVSLALRAGAPSGDFFTS